MIKNDPDYKGHFYYTVLGHVQSLEKIRIAHNVPASDFEPMVLTMMNEIRRENIKDQARLNLDAR